MLCESGKYYHLFNRTNNRERLFHTEENKRYFCSKLQRYLTPHCSILAFVLMPNHFHLLFRCETDMPENISRAVAVTLRSYTRGINRQYARTGSLFQQNTKALEVKDEQYLLTLIAYIHQNPVRAGLVSTVEEWKYSSFHDLTGFGQRFDHGMVLNKDCLKGFFADAEELAVFINTSHGMT